MNKIYTEDKSHYTFKTAMWGGSRKVVVRNSKGQFVSVSKWHKTKGYTKTRAMTVVARKTHQNTYERRKDIPQKEKAGTTADLADILYVVKFQKAYESGKSNKDITYEAEGTFNYEPKTQDIIDMVQRSFAGAFYAQGKVSRQTYIYENTGARNPNAHKMSSKLFKELADRDDIVNGIEIQKVKKSQASAPNNMIESRILFKPRGW